MVDERDDAQVKTVVEGMSASYPEMPAEEIEDLARAALAKTADARVQGHRIPLAEREVRDQVLERQRVDSEADTAPTEPSV